MANASLIIPPVYTMSVSLCAHVLCMCMHVDSRQIWLSSYPALHLILLNRVSHLTWRLLIGYTNCQQNPGILLSQLPALEEQMYTILPGFNGSWGNYVARKSPTRHLSALGLSLHALQPWLSTRLSPKDDFCSLFPGDMWQHLETHSIVPTGIILYKQKEPKINYRIISTNFFSFLITSTPIFYSLKIKFPDLIFP